MKTEREMFEEWFCKNHTGLKPNDLLKFRLPEGYSFKDPIKINLMWEAWKSSASREGYKLVPLELVDEIEDKIWDNLSANHTITNQEGDGFIPVEDIDLGAIYKAMIGACDDH